jgi:hypothetical protein
MFSSSSYYYSPDKGINLFEKNEYEVSPILMMAASPIIVSYGKMATFVIS